MRWYVGLALGVLLALGCDDDAATTTDPPMLDSGDLVDGALDGTQGDATSADAGADADMTCPDAAPDPFVLPACERACDRLVDCSVDLCVGYNWATAGGLNTACLAACDGTFEQGVLDAASCEAVQAVAEATAPDYRIACDDDVCLRACTRFGQCITDVCPNLGEPAGTNIAMDCAADCGERDPGVDRWLLEAPCEEIIVAISDDPGFANACGYSAHECASAADCAAWAAKSTGCMAEHCDDNLDPWAPGIEQALAGYCTTDANCPTPDEVALTLSDETTCNHPILAQLGPAPPFTGMCDGSINVDYATTYGVCEVMIECPELAVFANGDLCAVFLGMQPDVQQRVECLITAGADCADIMSCLEGI